MEKMNPQKLLVINQYYPPDIASTGRYVAEICSYLSQQGFEVHMITGQPSYTSEFIEASSYEILNEVHVYRISLGNAYGRERMLRRIKGYLLFLWGAWRKADIITRSKRIESVLTFHNPPFVGLIGAYLARKYRLRFTFAWYDIYPDALIVAGWYLPRFVIWMWEKLNRWIFKHVNSVIVLGEEVKRRLCENKGLSLEKVKVIPIWGYPELGEMSRVQPIRQELGIGDKELLLLYAGNLGVMHPIDPILDAAVMCQELPVQFLFVGEGVRKKYLISRIEKENLKNVRLIPYQPEERFAQIVATSDVCFVVFKSGMEKVTIPSRAFTFLSAGKPLITIMAPNADVARLVIETKCGWNVSSSKELVNLIRQLLNNLEEVLYRGQRGREVYESQFQRVRVIARYREVLLK
jgi:glycosyltransferase involved in cell wall biosynthesis